MTASTDAATTPSAPTPSAPTAPAETPLPRPEVRIVTGHLSDAEVTAVVAALAAVNAASHAEAHERALAQGSAAESCGWDDAVHRLPGMHAARAQATAAAWQFSHR